MLHLTNSELSVINSLEVCIFAVWAQRTGFVQSLEFLKKYKNLQTSFPDLEKVWKIKIMSGKNEKKSGKSATSVNKLNFM